MKVHWVTCGENRVWCGLETVDLSNVTASGVYLIWHAGTPARAVYVGQGDIPTRLQAHRTSQNILKYNTLGRLLVTWTQVDSPHRDGVERYLADRYKPLEGETHPAVVPIEVNLPGQ